MSRLTELEFEASKEGGTGTQLLCGIIDCPSSNARCWISCTICCVESDEKLLKLCQDLQISKKNDC